MVSAIVSFLALDPSVEPIHRAVAAAWPAGVPGVRFKPEPLPAAHQPVRDLSGITLIDVGPAGDLRTLAHLIDRLDDLRRAIIVLAPASRLAALERVGEGVVVLPRESDPAAIALALSALVQRRAGVELLLSEHDALQRSQNGLQREMEHIRDELQLAARVQREFMPKRLPETPGIEVAALFRPCGYVSGDIYDVVRLDEHHVGFFIADAVGHGVPAALMTMVLSHGMNMKEIRGNEYRIVPPSQVLQRCNDALIAGNMPSDRFLTAAYGVIDSRTLSVRFAGAGHPAPVIVSPRGSRTIETEGPLLGVFPGAEFEETTFTLDEDETLVLYSDGFETAFPETPETTISTAAPSGFSRRLPTTHYLGHFARLAGASREPGGLRQAFAELTEAVDHQSGSLHQVDDITALALARQSSVAALRSTAA